MRAVCGKGRVMAWVKSPNSWTEPYSPVRWAEACERAFTNTQEGADTLSPYYSAVLAKVSKLGKPEQFEIRFEEWVKE